MKIAFDYNGGMIIKDDLGQIHKFLPFEAKEIGKAYYSYVQKKKLNQTGLLFK